MKTILNITLITLLMSILALPVSCSLTGDDPADGGGNLEGEMTIEVDQPLIRADGNSSATIIVKIGGVEVTEGVTLYDASTNKVVDIPGMKFTTNTPGRYSFWAAYKTKHSETVTVTAISAAIPELPADPSPTSTDFSRRVLIQQFTGTNCGFCPFMVNLLRNFGASPANEGKWILAAIHTYNQTDPAYISTPIDGAMGVGSYPTVCLDLDKTTRWSNYNDLNGFQKLFNTEYNSAKAKAGIALSSVLDGNQLVVKLGVKAAEDGVYGLARWVLEDGINGKQANNGASGTESYDIHNNCVRLIVGQNSSKVFSGEKVSIKAGEMVERYYLLDIQDDWVGANMHILGIVNTLNPSGDAYTANNVVNCPVDDSVAYSYNN